MLEQICSIARAKKDISKKTKCLVARTLTSARTELRAKTTTGGAQLIIKESVLILLADMNVAVTQVSSGTLILDDASTLTSAKEAFPNAVNSPPVQTKKVLMKTTGRKDTFASVMTDIMDRMRLALSVLTRTSAILTWTIIKDGRRRAQVRLLQPARTWSYMPRTTFTICHLCAFVITDTGMDVRDPTIINRLAETVMNAKEKVSTHVRSQTEASVRILSDHTRAIAIQAMNWIILLILIMLIVWIRRNVQETTYATLMPNVLKRKVVMIACATPDMKETESTVTISMSAHSTPKFADSETAWIMMDHTRATASMVLS